MLCFFLSPSSSIESSCSSKVLEELSDSGLEAPRSTPESEWCWSDEALSSLRLIPGDMRSLLLTVSILLVLPGDTRQEASEEEMDLLL